MSGRQVWVDAIMQLSGRVIPSGFVADVCQLLVDLDRESDQSFPSQGYHVQLGSEFSHS